MPVARCLRTTSQVQTSTPFEHQHSTGYTYVLITAHDNHMLHVDDSMAFGMPTADVPQAFSSTCVHHTSTPRHLLDNMHGSTLMFADT